MSIRRRAGTSRSRAGGTARVAPNRSAVSVLLARVAAVAPAVPAILSLLALTAGLRTAAAEPPPILSLEDVRPGMTGIGRTVFQGETIEEFGVEILGVMKNARPQGDLILFRGEGATLEHTGIIAGMSGSPVFIGDRLVGAVAFAYPLGKDPIGAIVPIREMLALFELSEPPGAPGHSPEGAGGAGARLDDGRRGGGVAAYGALLDRFLSPDGAHPAAPVPAGTVDPAATVRAGGFDLRPLGLPLAYSGWDAALVPVMQSELARLGLVGGTSGGGAAAVAAPARSADPAVAYASAPVGAGIGLDAPAQAPAHGVKRAEDPARLVPGAAVGVQLVRGDASLAAVGTVTYVDGDRILAFGHPMIQSGPVSLPMTAAWIHTVIPSLEVSFKLGSATGLVGGIWEDRRPGIAGSMGVAPDMLPVRVAVDPAEGPPSEYRYSVVRHPTLTPMLLPWTVANSYMAQGWSQGEAAAWSETIVHYGGGREARRTDRYQTEVPGLVLGTEAALPAALLWENPFQPAGIDSVVVRLRYERANLEAQIERVEVVDPKIEVGDSLEVRVVLRPYRHDEEVWTVVFPVEPGWRGKDIVVVAGGAEETLSWDRDRAPGKYAPETLEELVTLIETVPSDGSLIVRVAAREPGYRIAGADLPRLPPSLARAAVAPGSESRARETAQALLAERTLETRWVVRGRQGAEVEVED